MRLTYYCFIVNRGRGDEALRQDAKGGRSKNSWALFCFGFGSRFQGFTR